MADLNSSNFGDVLNTNSIFSNDETTYTFATFYEESILTIKLANNPINFAGLSLIEGELGVKDNSFITADLNSNGDIIMNGNESFKYSIDNNGELIYTE